MNDFLRLPIIGWATALLCLVGVAWLYWWALDVIGDWVTKPSQPQLDAQPQAERERFAFRSMKALNSPKGARADFNRSHR